MTRTYKCPNCGGEANTRGSYACNAPLIHKASPLGRLYYWHDRGNPFPQQAWCVHVLSCNSCEWIIRQEGRFEPAHGSGR